MRNYKIGESFNSFKDEFLVYLYTQKSIYYAPAGKVIPTKFFLGWSWVASGQLEKQMKNFRPAESYEAILQREIRKALQKCPVVMTNGKLEWRSLQEA